MRLRPALVLAPLALIGLLGATAFPGAAEAAGGGRKKEHPAPETEYPKVDAPDSESAPESESAVKLKRGSEAFGKRLGLEVEASVPESGLGIDSSFTGTVISKQRSLVDYELETSPDLKTGDAGLFVGGIELISIEFPLDQLAWKKRYRIAPIEMKVGTIGAPVGPLIVTLGAGFALEAEVEASVTPFAAIPVEDSSVQIHVSPMVKSLAFVEGSAALVVLKAGVRGEVVLIDADLDLYTQLYFKPSKPFLTTTGTLEYLSGDFFAFLDYFNVVFWEWDHLWKKSLFSWQGHCRSFAGSFDSSGACVR